MVMMVTANWQRALCVFQHFEQARRVDHVLRAHLGASIIQTLSLTYLLGKWYVVAKSFQRLAHS
jgi:hypothetical protein